MSIVGSSISQLCTMLKIIMTHPPLRVQSLSDSGITEIPKRYVKPPKDRPISSKACRNCGFFQVVNHGVPPELMDQAREVWREFFHKPMKMKQCYANSPKTYEGYGSRLAVEKGVILDWSDYYFLHYLPCSFKDHQQWPALPVSLREVIEEFSKQVMNFGGHLMKVLSANLGLRENYLENAFGGGEDIGACLRVNFYPKCPQPDLTLGLSPHSNPGGLTFLLPDQHLAGLQVRRNSNWITVKPAPHAFTNSVRYNYLGRRRPVFD
ncbi:hypothetical protein RND71_030670 [Anisodus tanguticus]|uniref:Fe2OG dioxygenase domain-containing protein n=1 Tax=Anisodus tanguticus TaxID=243964 RepID=A0AAE1RI47_9SOLA|nr:hypothetical protein RND71_030670 [Anisodus tanguticus]